MKSLKRKVMSMFLILVISLFVGTCISSKVNAATKPLLTEKKISVLKGQKQRIGLLYNSKNAKWSVSNKRIKIVKKNNNYSIIKGIKKGDSVLTAKVGSKRYKCKIVCFLQALFGQSCKTFLDIIASPNWTKLQSLDWQLSCQPHSHCRQYLVVTA